ncbi:MAG: ankyrin repeat domain-containing protein [Syntrophaceae bacterium]|nr:ankyrin repeat domain-containing protein [Syntrophaceae bacterium]
MRKDEKRTITISKVNKMITCLFPVTTSVLGFLAQHPNFLTGLLISPLAFFLTQPGRTIALRLFNGTGPLLKIKRYGVLLLLPVLMLSSGPVVQKAHADNLSDSSIKTREAMVTTEQFLDAVRNGSFEEVKAALAQGIDINVQNEFGESALHLVKKASLAQYLIEHGAAVNLTESQYGMTPIFFQEVPIARLLVAAGANVNARSNKGNTPLIWFAYSNYLEGIKYLISVGADLQAANADGKTALDVAEGFAEPELVEYLRTHGAKKGNSR